MWTLCWSRSSWTLCGGNRWCVFVSGGFASVFCDCGWYNLSCTGERVLFGSRRILYGGQRWCLLGRGTLSSKLGICTWYNLFCDGGKVSSWVATGIRKCEHFSCAAKLGEVKDTVVGVSIMFILVDESSGLPPFLPKSSRLQGLAPMSTAVVEGVCTADDILR